MDAQEERKKTKQKRAVSLQVHRGKGVPLAVLRLRIYDGG
jgi:hypothetical protein